MRVVFCSSKTRAEIEALLAGLKLSQPFVAENGGGIFVPDGYFSFSLGEFPLESGFRVIALGAPYASLVRALDEAGKELGVELTGFSRMSVEEVAQVCGLGLVEASRAKLRQFDEPFSIPPGRGDEIETELRAAVARRGLCVVQGGRFFHITGVHDKGIAVRRLNELFERELGSIDTIGIGDSANDLPMLAAVGRPILVRKPSGDFDDVVLAALPGIAQSPGIGPAAWAAAVREIAGQYSARKRKGRASD